MSWSGPGGWRVRVICPTAVPPSNEDTLPRDQRPYEGEQFAVTCCGNRRGYYKTVAALEAALPFELSELEEEAA